MKAIENLATTEQFARTIGELRAQDELFPSPFIDSPYIDISESESLPSPKSEPLTFAAGVIGAQTPHTPWDDLALRQGNYGCSHLQFRLSASPTGDSLKWVALKQKQA